MTDSTHIVVLLFLYSILQYYSSTSGVVVKILVTTFIHKEAIN